MTSPSSLDRVLGVLELFTEERLEWTPEELMAELGYSRPTLYRYLRKLKQAGLLTSLPNAGFTLGPRVVEMDYLMRKSDALVRHGQPFLERLSGRYPCAALLVRWYGNRLLCVASESATPNPLTSYPRGRPMPISRGAISRAIMAFLPRRQLVPLIEENFSELEEIGLGHSIEEIVERLKKVRKAGCAVAHGEVTPGVVGVAAPVFDAASSPIAAICTTVLADRITGADIEPISADVRGAAKEISSLLSRRRAAECGPGRDSAPEDMADEGKARAAR